MKPTVLHILQGLLLALGIAFFVLAAIGLDDRNEKPVNPLNKYDSITAKLPVEEKLVFFNDKPKRIYRDKLGILTVEF